MSHRYQNHKGRNQRRSPQWHTQSQEQRYREDQRERMREEEKIIRLNAEGKARFDALPAEERARIETELAQLAARMHAEHLWQVECREKRDRERRENITFGT
jgi:hypothetical protein